MHTHTHISMPHHGRMKKLYTNILEKEMATHSSILAWRIPMDRRVWQATVHGIARVRLDLVTKQPPICVFALVGLAKANTHISA